MRVLGVDFGLRRLGLALSDPGGLMATPLRTLAITTVREAPAVVAAVAWEVGAGEVVVGVPLGLEGEEARPEVRRVRRFAKALRSETGLAVHLIDESLSSREAEERGSRTDRRKSQPDPHAVAAAIILQRWLDRPRHRGRGDLA
jgi:putative Holliday junction resolvase